MANKTIKKIIGISILSGVLVLSGCGGSEERQAEYLSRAQEYFDQENISKATIEIKNVLQINPKNADARYLLGRINEEDENFRAAISSFLAAVELDSGHIKSLNKLATYFLLSKDISAAQEKVDTILAIDAENADALGTQAAIFFIEEKQEKAMEKAQLALSIEPGHAQATTILAAIYANDNPDLALEALSKSIATQSNNESLKLLKLKLLASQNKGDEVVQLFEELITEYPDKLIYIIQLSNFQLTFDATEENEAERKNAAEKTYRDAIARLPEQDQIKLLLVNFLIKNRDVDAGREQLEAFLAESPDSSVIRNQLAQLYMASNDIDKAIALYQYVIDTTPEDPAALEARNRLITIALSQGDREKADTLLAEIFDKEPENVTALIIRAKLKLQKSDVDGAISDLRVVLKNAPESVEALLLLARAHEVNNSVDLALDNYQRLLTIQPKNLLALMGSGRLLMAKNQPDDALTLLEAANAINDGIPDVVSLLAELYAGDQRWDDALSVSAKLTENDQTMTIGYYLQGRIYLQKKDFELAADSLEKSLELQPAGIETLGSLVEAYVELEQLDKAITFVAAHVEKYPTQLHAREVLSKLYRKNGDLKAALNELNIILEKNPGKNSAYFSLASIYFSQGKTDKVEELYLSGLEKKPDNDALRLALAEYYQIQKNYQKAVDTYEILLANNPAALVIKNNLASLLIDYFNTPETVARASELAADLAATETPAFLDTAGWIQYQQANYPQAISLLGAAIEMGGKGSEYHYHLGMAYFKSDMKVQAKEQLELALADEKAVFAGKEEARRTLDQL